MFRPRVLQSQADTAWTKIYGIYGTDFQHTSDGGYIICGGRVSAYCPYLIKTDSNGDTVWTSQLDSSIVRFFTSVQQTSDGGYILGGNRTPDEARIIKMDTLGDTTWTKSYRRIEEANVRRIIETSEGGYLVLSHLGSYGRNVWLLKTDSHGDSVWSKIYGNSQFDDYPTSVLQTSDGNFVFCGAMGDPLGLGYGHKGWIRKVDELGDTLWTRKYQNGNGIGTELWDVQETIDGKYLFSGVMWDYPRHPLLIKTDLKGHTLWIKNYDSGGVDLIFSHGITSDNEIIAAGLRFSNYGDSTSLFLMKTNSGGDLEWTKTIPGIKTTERIKVRVVSNKEFTVLCDNSNWNTSWLLKFSENITDMQARTDGNTTQSYNLKQNYPNPFNPITTIEFDLSHTCDVTLKIFNILGEEITTLVSKKLFSGTHSFTWDASFQSSGLYFYKLETNDFSEIKKMLLIQ